MNINDPGQDWPTWTECQWTCHRLHTTKLCLFAMSVKTTCFSQCTMHAASVPLALLRWKWVGSGWKMKRFVEGVRICILSGGHDQAIDTGESIWVRMSIANHYGNSHNWLVIDLIHQPLCGLFTDSRLGIFSADRMNIFLFSDWKFQIRSNRNRNTQTLNVL